jgi:hypothetical protein
VVVVFGDLDPVLELRAGEHVGDELVAVEPPPTFLGGIEQLVATERAAFSELAPS